MKFSQIKEIRNFCDNLFSTPNWREVVEKISGGETDFEVEGVRFITGDTILSVLAEELQSDLYCLGCFNARFIADMCNWPIQLVEAAQKGEAFEALGKAIADNCDMERFANAYAGADGYGHHFNRYDGSEEELVIGDVTFHVFDNH